MSKMEGMGAFTPDPKNKVAMQEEKERKALQLHTEGLHDETPKNETMDLATGKKYEAATDLGNLEGKHAIRAINKKDKSEDIMGSLRKKNDAAEKWLREHGEAA